MNDNARPPHSTRRDLIDGTCTVLFLSIAIVFGYGVLSPSTRARPMHLPAMVGSVVAMPAADTPVTPAAPPALSVEPESVEPADAPAAAARLAPTASLLARPRPEGRPSVPEPRVLRPEPAPELPWPSPTWSS